MKIAYFGGDMFFSCMEMLLENNHEITSLFTIPIKNDEYDFTQNVVSIAKQLDIPVIRRKPTIIDIKALQQQNCDMILSAGYKYKIPQWQGKNIKYGVNIHPSLLPEGAGSMPLPLVIIKGLKETGVTLHELSPEWDAGNIILQESFPLLRDENIKSLLYRSQELASSLLEKFLSSPNEYWNNSFPQVRKDGDYWNAPAQEDFIVDYSKDPESIKKYLLAHRFIHHDGTIESVSNISFKKQKHGFKTGTVISEDNNIYIIAATDGLMCFKLERE